MGFILRSKQCYGGLIWIHLETLVLNIVLINLVFDYQTATANGLSRSVNNFIKIRNNGNQTIESYSQTAKRSELLPVAHEGWNRGWSHFHNNLRVPDFGYHDIHESDEHGEKLELESHPRHYLHHGPHYLHEIHSHYGEEHPHGNHEHYVYREPMHHESHMMHHGHNPMMHHHGHHFEHHDEEESGDHDEHHDYGEEVHGEGDWDVGGGYFQLEEHGSDVNVVALKKHGTKVHMSGGDFNVIRDPWRHHSLFAGLFHPHEMPGHGHLPMEQFHQHFTYIANDKAINHHSYEHNTHLEDNHEHHHDEERHHGHDDEHDKRHYFPSSAVNVAMQAQTKQEITGKLSPDIITIPLHKISDKNPVQVDGVVSENADTRDSKNAEKEKSKDDKHKKELPKVEVPRLEPLDGIKFGPKNQGTIMEIPLVPLFKRQLIKRKIMRKPETDITIIKIVKRSNQDRQSKTDLTRGSRLARAFLGKIFQDRTKTR